MCPNFSFSILHPRPVKENLKSASKYFTAGPVKENSRNVFKFFIFNSTPQTCERKFKKCVHIFHCQACQRKFKTCVQIFHFPFYTLDLTKKIEEMRPNFSFLLLHVRPVKEITKSASKYFNLRPVKENPKYASKFFSFISTPQTCQRKFKICVQTFHFRFHTLDLSKKIQKVRPNISTLYLQEKIQKMHPNFSFSLSNPTHVRENSKCASKYFNPRPLPLGYSELWVFCEFSETTLTDLYFM